jgi:tetratricopeptide (TPR) repeat protein
MSVALPAEAFAVIVLLPLVASIVLILFVAQRDRRKWAYRRDTGDMLLDRLKNANAQISRVVKAENDAIVSIAMLSDDVDLIEAELVLRSAMPGSSLHDRQALMLHAWEVQRRPQALAVLAGMALADLENTYSSLGPAFRTALKVGSPALLDQIASALDQRRDALDNWLCLSLPFYLAQAAQRIEQDTPVIAARVQSLADCLTPRWRELQMAKLRFEIQQWEERDDQHALEMAGALAELALPRFPELVAEVHAALDRHMEPEWERAHAWFDKAVIHRFYDLPIGLEGFDFNAAVKRLAGGIMSGDATVSQFVAEQAADFLGDSFIDAPYHRRQLQEALDAAICLHGLNPNYEWLDDELDPSEIREETFRSAEETISLHASVEAGVSKLVETTATMDPDVALAELRQILPEAPPDILRTALVARWRADGSPVLLPTLVGLAGEAADGEPVDGKLVWRCLHWPLRAGSAEEVDAAVTMLQERLDGWAQLERSLRDLEGACKRLAVSAPETVGRVKALLDRLRHR